ncbi:MAG: hypothetical protein ACI4RD_07115 [Kiritimatiellia bacterium]
MKAIKFLLKLVFWLIVLVVVALLTLPLWFGPVVKTVAGKVAPKVAQIELAMEHLSLNPYTARFELRGLRVGNPAGYPERYAATVGDVVFDAEAASLVTDVIHIEEIRVRDVFVSYVSGGPDNVNNFRQIQYNLAGGKEQYEAAQAERRRQQATEEAAPDEPEPTEEADRPAKRFIIDRLEIAGLTVQLGFLPLKLPVGLTLTDLGKESGGATLAEVSQQIWNEILKAAGAAGDRLKALGALATEAGKTATETVGRVTEAAADVAADGAKAVGEGAKAVGKGVKDVGSGVKDVVGDGKKAVGEGAKQTLDSLKRLW